MSNANTYLVVASADFNNDLPSILKARYKSITGVDHTWKTFSEIPNNVSRFGRPIVVSPAEYNVSTTLYVVPFEAFTTTGERAEIQLIRGARPDTDFRWAILSSSELGIRLAQLRKDEVD